MKRLQTTRQGWCAVTIQKRHPVALLAAAVAGFGMVVWLFVEVAITGYSWLQAVYLLLGIGELALVMAILGILHTSGSPHGANAQPRPG